VAPLVRRRTPSPDHHLGRLAGLPGADDHPGVLPRARAGGRRRTNPSTTERQAYDLVAAGFGVGYNGPLQVASQLEPAAQPSAEYTKKYNKATSLQKQLNKDQKTLPKQQKQLQQQQKQLQAQQAKLTSRATS